MSDRKTALDEHALDRLMLATDEAVTAYQEQRLKLQAARKVRGNRQRAAPAHTRTGGDKALKEGDHHVEARSNANVP